MGMNLKVNINGFSFKNPIIPASGTFNFGREMSELYNLSILGGIVSKGITLIPKRGNPPPRIAETSSGILNSVGLQNPGVKNFILNEADFLCSQGCVSIVNVAGSTVNEYIEITKLIEKTRLDIIELNLSCPNVNEGCMLFGSDPKAIYEVVSRVKDITKKPIWVKLTPNTGSITNAAISAEKAGADGISLINTLLGLSVDIMSRRPIIKNNYAGLSGPAIKPIALRMVNEVYNNIKIPVIGMGGIMNAKDVLEFMMAGASLVQVGTANLINPYACLKIIEELPETMKKYNITSLEKIMGSLKLWDIN